MATEARQVRRSVKFNLTRKEGQRAIVEGIAYPAFDPVEGVAVPQSEFDLRVDSYNTFMRRDTLETLAHLFLEYSRSVDSHHDHGVVGGLVESYLTRDGDPDYPANVWVAVSKVFDQGAIKELDDGKLTGYSIDILCREKPVEVTIKETGKKVKLGELYDCEPRFLSLVERPAIHQPFTNVQVREDQPRVVIVRCEEPMGTEKDDSTQTEKTQKDPVLVPEKQEQIERFTRSILSPERNEALKIATREVTDWTSFATVWGAVKDRLAAWGGLDDAYNLLYQVICSIRYDDGTDAEKAVKVSQACADFASAVTEIFGTLAGQSRSEKQPAQRVGKKISSANMTKLKTMCDAIGTTHTELSSFITEHDEGEEARTEPAAAVDDKSKSQMSDKATAAPAAKTEATETKDHSEVAKLREEIAKRDAEHTKQLSELRTIFEQLLGKPKRSKSNEDPAKDQENETREEEDEDGPGLFGNWFEDE